MNFDKHRDLSSISSSKEKKKEEQKKTTSKERSRRNPHRRNIKILQKSNFSTLASIEKNPRSGGFHCGRQGLRQFAKLFANLL
jgi:hypothetical protein